jgi:hypothetical protein
LVVLVAPAIHTDLALLQRPKVHRKESGRHSSRRKLTKQGNPESLRLLHNVAMAAARIQRWKDIKRSTLACGLQKIEALTIPARKLTRIALALMKTRQPYRHTADAVD